ncbi:MAG: zinc metallopeptidase [Anaerolineales bacterium]
MPLFIDPIYIIFVMIPALVLSGAAQLYLRSTYGTWKERRNSANVNGVETARTIMRHYGLNVQLQRVQQELGDHFNPSDQSVGMSPHIADAPSIASMAVAAHEFGHVQQYHENSPLIAVRTALLPVAQFGNYGAYILILLGVFLNFFGLALLGLILFGGVVLFSVLTLPVEFDASRRAMKMLNEVGLIKTQEDRRGAQAVLRAAALTYVAATAGAILNFAYYALLVFSSRD